MPSITNRLEVAFKNDWQGWMPLPGADPVFYDPTLPFKGLNKDSSRYSGVHDYDMFIRLIADVAESPTDTHTTEYIYTSAAGRILDDDTNINLSPLWSAVTTFKKADGSVLGPDPNGKQLLIYNELMTMETVFTLASGNTADYPNAWGIHYAQKTNGGDDIEEFSSIRDNRTDGILQPLAALATNHLKVEYVDATHIKTSCLVDGSKLLQGQGYYFTAKIDFSPS